jgi:hypothetical protein
VDLEQGLLEGPRSLVTITPAFTPRARLKFPDALLIHIFLGDKGRLGSLPQLQGLYDHGSGWLFSRALTVVSGFRLGHRREGQSGQGKGTDYQVLDDVVHDIVPFIFTDY